MPSSLPPPARPTHAAHMVAEAEEDRLRVISGHEEAVLIDGRTGAVILRKVGITTSVSFDDAELARMAGHVLTHNHPLGWNYPTDDPRHAGDAFSPADIALMVEARLGEIRAISPRYIHVMQPPSPETQSMAASYYRNMIATLSYAEIRAKVTEYAGVVRARLRRRIHDPNDPLIRNEADARVWHDTCEMVAFAWGVNYERKERTQ